MFKSERERDNEFHCDQLGQFDSFELNLIPNLHV